MNENLVHMLIACALVGGFEPRPSFIASIEGEGNADGGGGKGKGEGDGKTGPPKTFTQEDVDKIIDARTARWSRDTDTKVAEAVKAETGKRAELQAKLDELSAKLEDAGKSEPQKELAKLQREFARVSQALEESGKKIEGLTSERDGATTKLKTHIVNGHLRDALSAAKVLPAAAKSALLEFSREVTVELDEDGAVASVAIGKRQYEDVQKAAAAFLDTRPFFASHPGGGAGTRGGGGPRGGALGDDDMDVDSLLERGFRQNAAGQRRAG